MRIDKLTKLKNGLYEVKLDDGEKYKLTEDVIIENNLYNEKQMTDDVLKTLKSLTNYSRIYTATLNYLSYKMHTVSEIRSYLKDKGAGLEDIEAIVNKLIKLNYLNDQVYAESYAKHQFGVNKKGVKLIARELADKQVEQTVIDQSLSGITDDANNENIETLIAYYEKMNRNKSVKKLKESILKNLIAKGYDYDDIITQLNAYEFSSEETEQELLQREIAKVYERLKRKYTGTELKNAVLKHLLMKGFNYEDIASALKEFFLEG